MKIAYLDVFCGISGDMMLGALVDAGVPLADLEAELRKLPVHGWKFEVEEVRKMGLRATKLTVADTSHHHHHDHDEHRDHHHGMSADAVIDIIKGGDLAPHLIERAVAVVERIAEAEAAAHGVPREQVHFHELGGVDTVIDVVGAVVGLDLLGIEKLYCSPLPMAHGFVNTAHGRLPVPPPAVVNLLPGIPTVVLDVEGETVTPTGAGLAVVLAEFTARPPMTVSKIGLGAGYKDFPVPNVLRLMIGEAEVGTRVGGATGPDDTPTSVVKIEANLDDMSPELFGFAAEQIFAAGAVDVWATPIFMKKNRPATLLSAVCAADRADSVITAILTHTTSFGVRTSLWQRECLDREHVSVETAYGTIRIKLGRRDGKTLTAAPEYADCAAAAEASGVPLKAVYQAAIAAAHSLLGEAQ